MKKLLTLSFAVLFVVALSSLSHAQPTLALEAEADEVVVEQIVAQPDPCPCFGPAPFRPLFRGHHASNYANPCFNPCPTPCPPPCPPPCPFAFQRSVAAPQYDCAADPCAYPAYGHRTPIRNFFSRIFAPRYYDYNYCY